MYLSAVVKKAGHECRIVALADAYDTAIKDKPDVIGFSVMTGDLGKVSSLTERIKDFWPKRTKKPQIIVGGPDPTFWPQGYEWADHVVKGEGEQWMADFLRTGYDKAEGLNIFDYHDIDSIPVPDRTDFPNQKIRDFITSRGCSGTCSYCYNQRWSDMFPDVKRIRIRDPKLAVAEIVSLFPEFVYFQDSCFGTSMKWLREFSSIYRSRVNIPFHAHLRPNQVSEERVLLLHDANCYSVRIALETASTRLRKLLNRNNYSVLDVVSASRLLRKWSIKVMVQNMIGLPTGTIEDDLETLEFNIKARPAYGWCSIFSPYPGTELGDYCKANGIYKGNYSNITDCFFDTSVLNFTPEYIEQLECLQKVFALCTEVGYMPEPKELTHENFPKLVHKIMRQQGDHRLYSGVI